MTETADLAHQQRMRELKRKKDAEVRKRAERRGVVVVNEGDGKGKSTAAFGTVVRALGHGQRVGIVQFVKGTWRTGEKTFFSQHPQVDLVQSGEGFTWNTQDRSRDLAAAARGLAAAGRMIEECRGDVPRYGLVVLDEINIALGHGLLAVEEVVDMVVGRPRELSLVLTGRGAMPEITAVADTVTRMELVKHAYQDGVRARRGVDF